MDNNLSIQRLPVSASKIYQLVDAKIAEFFQQAQKFTAYSVTQALRMDNPMLEIEHDSTSAAVQIQMQQGTYASFPHTVGLEDWNGTEATTYIPTYAVMTSTATPVSDPVLPAAPVVKIQNPQLGWPQKIEWPDDTQQ